MSPESASWRGILDHCLDVAATPDERPSWITRSLCEAALAFHLGGGPWDLFDDAVSTADLDGADPRLAARLHGLRQLHGRPPRQYSVGDGPALRPAAPNEIVQEATVHILQFAAELPTRTRGTARTSPRNGLGAHAVDAAAERRPSRRSPTRSVTYLDTDIDPGLIWRGWCTIPGVGIVRAVPDELLSTAQMRLWWGIHDGCHLDHLRLLDEPSQLDVQFGSGLLVAEALAMVCELIAGAEAHLNGDEAVASEVRRGLLERVGRFDVHAVTTPSFARQIGDFEIPVETEFAALPSIATAYVLGPLDLIASGFRSPLVPRTLTDDITQRWDELVAAVPAVRALDTASRALAERHRT